MKRSRRPAGTAGDRELARFTYLMLAALLTGNEFGGWIGMHPALDTLPPESRVAAEQAVYRRYGKVMPVLMTATLVAASQVLARAPDRRSVEYRRTAASATCYAAMLVITLTRNIPINVRLLALENRPEDYPTFVRLRSRWNRLHTARNLLNLTGLALAVRAALRW